MKKLLEFQKKVKGITKDSVNPFFKSKYFDINSIIEEIKPILNEIGLVIMQPLTNIDGKMAISTLIIDADDGKVLIESVSPLPENNDPQKMGSAITYFRRYALQSMLLLNADDDDGNHAAQKPTPVSTSIINMKQTLQLLGADSEESALRIIKDKTGFDIPTLSIIDETKALEINKLLKL